MSQTAEHLAPTSRAKAPRDLRKYVPFLVLIIVCVAFSLVSEQFFSSRNLETVLRQTAVLSIAAMGGTFIIMMASIDLSVGSVVGLAAVVTAYFVGDYGYAAILMGVTVGAICGAAVGSVYAKLKVPSFIVTLGLMVAGHGMMLHITEGRPIMIRDPSLREIGSGSIGGVPPFARVSVSTASRS